jgi:hypothetical protein
MAGFLFRLETPEGLPADPPTLSSAVPNWKAGDTIPPGARQESGFAEFRRRTAR